MTPAGGLVIPPGESYAIGHGPQGALLLASAAGSWWAARDAASAAPEAAAPAQVSYEIPPAVVPAAAAKAAPGSEAAAPAPAAPPAAKAAPAGAAGEQPAATLGTAPGTTGAVRVHRSRLPLAAAALGTLIGAAGCALTIVRWWRRRQGGAP